MEFTCPTCRGQLSTTDGETARCANHPGEFRILFSRWKPPEASLLSMIPGATEGEVPPIVYTLPPGASCAQHHAQPAVYACGACGTPICGLCAFEDVDRGQICPACATRRTQRGGASGLKLAPHTPGARPPPAVVAGMRCVQHPEVPALWKCQACSSYMCDTCDFLLPGGVHVCPSCATAPQTGLSAGRKRQMYVSYGMAAWSTVATGLLMSGAFAGMVETEEGESLFGMLFMFADLVPAIIGLAMGFSAIDRRLVNPPSVWIAVVWNGLLVAGLILLVIIGMMSS